MTFAAALMRSSACAAGLRKVHREAAGAKVAPELLAEQLLDVGLVVDDENEQAHASSSRLAERCRRRAAARSGTR